jgi:branched-subunit amino acid ABC-type transport system permease component
MGEQEVNETIALILTQDGIATGAIYVLVALAIVLVFTVTRVLFVPQGEFVTLGALTLATLQDGRIPGVIWLLLGSGACLVLIELYAFVRTRRWPPFRNALVFGLALPLTLCATAVWLAPARPPLLVQIMLSLALVVPLGPFLYRIAFQPVANASVLLLLFVAVAAHYSLVGLELLFFGAEGWRTPAFSNARLQAGPILVTGQSLFVLATSATLMLLLWMFFARSYLGKSLRATAINRIGARLVGIRTQRAGMLAFTIAALLGAFSGILIAPLTTIYYDTGFLIGLKGFVGAVIGGMVSYPLAAAGAISVGLLESFASFWASALKEAIVFALLVPFLLWRSLTSPPVEDEDEE